MLSRYFVISVLLLFISENLSREKKLAFSLKSPVFVHVLVNRLSKTHTYIVLIIKLTKKSDTADKVLNK